MRDVWDKCPNPQWLLWIAARLELQLDQRALRLFACWCVRNTPLADGRTTWDLLTDERSRNAVIVSERFANGEATESELDAAGAAARAAAWDAAGAAARDVAWAAVGAAAGDAAWAAVGAAAGDAAWAAVGDVAGDAAGDAAWAVQATELRKHIPNPFPVTP
jgi:hypothetical protein